MDNKREMETERMEEVMGKDERLCKVLSAVHHHPPMLTMLAESSIVPGTLSDLQRLCINVEVLAVLVVALAKSLEEVADWHLGHVVLVKKLALVSLFAEMTKPVFADDGSLSLCMSEGTVAATNTRASQEELAQGCLILW